MNFPTVILIILILFGIFLLSKELKINYTVGKDSFDRTNRFGVKEYMSYDNYLKVTAINKLKKYLANIIRVMAAILIFIPLAFIFLKYTA